jgi:hypothetical protein
MKLSVRPADLSADRDALIELMLCFLTPMSDGPRYDWLYRQNPHGQAQLWILTDMNLGKVVGSGGIVPRLMYVGGQEKLGCVLVDFWIHPQYRSLGPALQLQRACLAGIQDGPYELYYDFPKQNMVAVYRRLGVEPRHSVVRLTKLLNLKRKLAGVSKIPLLGPSLVAGANFIVNFRDVRRGDFSQAAIFAQNEACGDEFTQLARAVSPQYGVCVARTADYLNWRFRSHFHHHYEMLTARRNGSLLGYILFLHEGEMATIVDLFGVEDDGVKSNLVSAALEILRKRGVLGVNAPGLSSHAQTAFVRKLGFYARESQPVVISAARKSHETNAKFAAPDFFLTDGDRDS